MLGPLARSLAVRRRSAPGCGKAFGQSSSSRRTPHPTTPPQGGDQEKPRRKRPESFATPRQWRSPRVVVSVLRQSYNRPLHSTTGSIVRFPGEFAMCGARRSIAVLVAILAVQGTSAQAQWGWGGWGSGGGASTLQGDV